VITHKGRYKRPTGNRPTPGIETCTFKIPPSPLRLLLDVSNQIKSGAVSVTGLAGVGPRCRVCVAGRFAEVSRLAGRCLATNSTGFLGGTESVIPAPNPEMRGEAPELQESATRLRAAQEKDSCNGPPHYCPRARLRLLLDVSNQIKSGAVSVTGLAGVGPRRRVCVAGRFAEVSRLASRCLATNSTGFLGALNQ
jgi:hypothetical protein